MSSSPVVNPAPLTSHQTTRCDASKTSSDTEANVTITYSTVLYTLVLHSWRDFGSAREAHEHEDRSREQSCSSVDEEDKQRLANS